MIVWMLLKPIECCFNEFFLAMSKMFFVLTILLVKTSRNTGISTLLYRSYVYLTTARATLRVYLDSCSIKGPVHEESLEESSVITS